MTRRISVFAVLMPELRVEILPVLLGGGEGRHVAQLTVVDGKLGVHLSLLEMVAALRRSVVVDLCRLQAVHALHGRWDLAQATADVRFGFAAGGAPLQWLGFAGSWPLRAGGRALIIVRGRNPRFLRIDIEPGPDTWRRLLISTPSSVETAASLAQGIK